MMRGARHLYYRHGYHRSFPGRASFEARLASWEAQDGRGDVPKGKDAWDAQYAGGGWDFLTGLSEAAHYAVIVGYADFLRPSGAVLDVGCGSGVLHDRFARVGYERYVGVDISEVAVAQLQERRLADARFVAADAESFKTDETFDVVVFNESITYFADPIEGFGRYLRRVAPGGVAIVSCHVQSARAQAILREIERRHEVLDATVVSQDDTSWRVVVIRPSV